MNLKSLLARISFALALIFLAGADVSQAQSLEISGSPQPAATLAPLTLQFVVMTETGYSDEKVRGLASKAVKVFEQCGVKPKLAIHIARETGAGLNGGFDIFDFNSRISILKEFRSQPVSQNSPVATSPTAGLTIKVFLLTRFQDKEYSAGLSFARWIDVDPTDIEVELQNTVWVATTELEVMQADPMIQYDTLAHELLHVLTRSRQHNGNKIPNLMAIYARRTDVILPADCALVRQNLLGSTK